MYAFVIISIYVNIQEFANIYLLQCRIWYYILGFNKIQANKRADPWGEVKFVPT